MLHAGVCLDCVLHVLALESAHRVHRLRVYGGHAETATRIAQLYLEITERQVKYCVNRTDLHIV